MTAPVMHDLLSDPRLATLALGAAPAWLWSPNGARVLFVNGAGAATLGERAAGALTGDTPERLRPAGAEIAKIAGGLPMSGAAQLARIRNLSTGLGRAILCLCQRHRLADGTPAVLVISQEPARAMPIEDRARRLIGDLPLAVFAANGTLLHAGRDAAALLGDATTLAAVTAPDALARALRDGESTGDGFYLRRAGTGDEALLIAHVTAPPSVAPDEPDEEPPSAAVVADEAPVPAPASEDMPANNVAPAITPTVSDAVASDNTPLESEAIEDPRHGAAVAAADDAETEMLAEAGAALIAESKAAEATSETKLVPASLADVARALAGLPLDPLGGEAIAEEDEDAPEGSEPAFPADELTEAELAELQDALFGDDQSDDPDVEEGEARAATGGDSPVWVREAIKAAGNRDRFDDDELRELQDALGSSVRLVPDAPPAAEPDGQTADQKTVDARLEEIAARLTERHVALRFVWATAADGTFTIEPGDFLTLAGEPTTAAQGLPWEEAVRMLAIDPDHRLARAVASRDTFSGVTVEWPIESAKSRLPVVLSGLPARGRDRAFEGYRCFGVCRDRARIAALIAERRDAATRAADAPPTTDEAPEAMQGGEASTPPRAEPPVFDNQSRPSLQLVPPSPNVVPFRSQSPERAQPEKTVAEKAERPHDERKDDQRKEDARRSDDKRGLSSLERNAFDEIAKQLGARFEHVTASPMETPSVTASVAQQDAPAATNPDAILAMVADVPAAEASASGFDARLIDRLPIGVMLYRGDHVIAANKTLLEWTGFEDAAALTVAGSAGALFDPVPNEGGDTALHLRVPGGTTPVEARLSSMPWQGHTAMLLTVMRRAEPAKEQPAQTDALAAAKASNAELRSILDTATDGVIVVGQDGEIRSANRSAQALFGYETEDFGTLKLLDLFAPESHRDAADYLEGLTRSGVASLLNDGREVIGRERQGGLIPLFMTMGRIGEERFCAVFRDITQWKRAEEELTNAKRQAEKASSAKSDFLAAISHEVRTPLNAILGFAEVMMEERLGPLGNERYREYVKDIHTSGTHTISLINDLLDLSKIEAGRLDLTFTKVDLNDVTQQCAAIMQPQANRERIIIRTALSPSLPGVVADQRSVKQIALNLLSNSIKYTGAGGQVIVSTALTDQGEVVLRVRDTGVGMSEKDIAAALEPFRQLSTTRRDSAGGTGLGLPLTKALSEANRAEFRIKSAVNAGTLVEIVFPATRVLSE